ncbi:helix-turn-helix transcriptional regulator [Aquabacterium sp. OR-4]|uniref:helix-turn-helix transcriptional regulator n=1 Tax=Aquabacterium sp. OR-4 TaxID=2978127 RepID=UPI0021B37787|nr:YafY family protein [Aquabacterium sp. OR-4]MDT7837759.1 YafY family protein [Aquabacterium sp. OR-4]
MSSPTSRVLALLELLQADAGAQGLGGAELARRLEVDRRTVRRYVNHLLALGVPVEARRGRDGGYVLRPGYRLPPMMFSDDEALALGVGLHVAGALGLGGITPAIASTQAKLARVLPAPLRQRLADIDATVALDLARPYAHGAPATLRALSAAARARQRVQLSYRAVPATPDSPSDTERAVDVYGLAWRGGAWYAVGHCHLRGALRCFRLDRVQHVQALPASFGRPEGFDVLAHLRHAIATLPRAHTVRVLLHCDPATARRAVFAELGTLTPHGRGVQLDTQADNLDWVARELARLPFAFSVQRPVALRRAIAALAARLLARA